MLVITDGADDVVQMQRAQRLGGDSGSSAPTAIIDYTDRAVTALRTGFYPSKAPDGKYRRVRVHVKNQDYRIRTRAGYLATRRK
jgi:hypothetical protein